MGQIQGIAALPILGRVFLALGLAGFVVAGSLTAIELSGARSAHADGVIVGGDMRARVQFATAEGETVEVRNDVIDTTTNVGDHVAIVYDPHNPHDAKVDGFGGRWLLRDIFCVLGGTFLIVGGGLTLAGRLAQRPRR